MLKCDQKKESLKTFSREFEKNENRSVMFTFGKNMSQNNSFKLSLSQFSLFSTIFIVKMKDAHIKSGQFSNKDAYISTSFSFFLL